MKQVEYETKTEDSKGNTTIQTKKYRIDNEEDYIKLYIKTMSALHSVEGSVGNTLTELLMRVGYDNQIVLVSAVKKQIAANLGIKPNTVDHHLGKLCKQKLLIRVDRGLYQLNTYVFGRGKWADIRDHRERLNLSVVFSDRGVYFEEND